MAKTRRRGDLFPELARALSIYLGEAPDANSLPVKRGRTTKRPTLHSIHAAICKEPERYGEPERDISIDAPQRELSIDAIRNAWMGRRILPKTARIVRAYLSEHAPSLIPDEPLPPVFLDMAKFFGMKSQKRRHAISILTGIFQSYAVSTSLPVKEGMIRRGLVRIDHNEDTGQINIFEHQHRPELKEHPEYELKWNGFCVLREESIFCVMRTELSDGKRTPLFCIYNIMSYGTGHRVNGMLGVSMGFDPEMNWPSFPTIFLERASHESKVLIDFCKEDEIPSYIKSRIIPSLD